MRWEPRGCIGRPRGSSFWWTTGVRSWLALLVLAGGCWFSHGGRPTLMRQESGEWGAYEVWLPRGEVQLLVFLLSPATGAAGPER